MKDSLNEFVHQTLQNELTDNKQFILGIVSDEVASKLFDESGIDVFNYHFAIDIYSIKHIMKSHGNPQKEDSRGQKAVTAEDFELINEVLTAPDIVFYDGKNKIGRDVFQFQKLIGDRYIIVKEVRTGRKQLALNTMRIVKTKKNRE